MKLSIITINYNNKAGLEKTIDSVMSQSWRDFEWIIIDGGSTDGSKEVIENLAKNPLSNISYWCSEPDGGIYQALNKGVNYTQGEYINFMNAGDTFHDLKVLEKVFSENQTADILYGDALCVFPDKQILSIPPKQLTFIWFYSFQTICHQSSFTKQEVFKNISFDTKYKFLADRKFWMECLLKGYTFRYVPYIIADYDHTGFSSQNQSKWEMEQTAIHCELIPECIRNDMNDFKCVKEMLYVPSVESLSLYSKGTLSAYRVLSRTFFRITKIHLLDKVVNFLYKVYSILK